MEEKDTNQNQHTEDEYEKICYICRRPESKAGAMIRMPGNMCLCHDCMQKTFDAVTKGSVDFSQISNMPFMNLNLGDLANMKIPDTAIPEKKRIRKKKKALENKKKAIRLPCFTGKWNTTKSNRKTRRSNLCNLLSFNTRIPKPYQHQEYKPHMIDALRQRP